MNAETDAWLKSSDSKDYFELLRMPTIGADPMHLRDCIQTATWLKKWLAKIGAEVELIVPEQPKAETKPQQPRRSASAIVMPNASSLLGWR